MPENSTLPNHRIALENRIFSSVREVPNFPKPGILFKDINPLLRDHQLCSEIIDHLTDYYSSDKPDCIASIESSRFYFGFPLALNLGIPFIPIRKKGKLPGDVLQNEYDLEYGTSTIELQKGVMQPNDKGLIHDDVLATGGTALAAAELVKACSAEIHSFNFIIELSFLKGQERLNEIGKNTYNLAVS